MSLLTCNIGLQRAPLGTDRTGMLHIPVITEVWRAGEAPAESKDACMHATYKVRGRSTSMDVYGSVLCWTHRSSTPS